MATKIVAGFAMMVPAFIIHVYHNRQHNSDTKTAITDTAQTWGTMGALFGIVGCAYVGVAHIMIGAFELSPKICARE